MGLPINSANINTFDYDVEYNLNTKQVTLTDASSYVNALNVVGIVFKLTSPSGIIYHNNTNYAIPDITPNLPSPFSKNMPTFNTAVEYGTYTVLGSIKDGDGTVYQLTKTLNVCKPKQCKGATGSNSCVTIEKKVDCLKSALIYSDVTIYTYNGVEGDVVCDVDVTFPTSTGLPPLLNNNIKQFSLSPIYNGAYIFTANNTATYDFGDGQTVVILYKLDETIDVNCSISLCELECALAEYIKEYETLKGTGSTKERTMASNIVLLSVKLQQLRMSIECGNDVTTLLTEVETILGKKCSCDCGAVNPAGAQVEANTTIQILEGCGDISVETTEIGNTTTFTVSDITYVIDTNRPNGVTITMNEEGCARTYFIDICPDNMDLCNAYYLQTINPEDISENETTAFNSDNNVGEVFNHFNNQIENLRQSIISYTQTLNWVTVTNSDLQDSWVNSIQVEYAKDILGFVHIRGTITNVSVSNLTALFTLPSGYIPNQNTAITSTVRNNSKTTYLAGEIEVNSITGDITFRNDGTFGVAGYLSLDGITFYAGFI
jgi:hypothetical protein